MLGFSSRFEEGPEVAPVHHLGHGYKTETSRYQGWRAGSMVKNTCSYKGPGFDSQHPRGSSLLSVIPVPGDPASFSDLPGHQACEWYIDIHIGKMYTKINLNNN